MFFLSKMNFRWSDKTASSKAGSFMEGDSYGRGVGEKVQTSETVKVCSRPSLDQTSNKWPE